MVRIVVAILLIAGAFGTAQAQVGIRVHEIADGGLRIDGSLRDWRHIRMTNVGEGRDASMRFAFGYDATHLYLGARVQDERLIRSANPGLQEDAIIITLATPSGRRFTGQEIFVFAGASGRSAGKAAVGGIGARRLRAINGAEVIEAPFEGGYTLEARIPWRRIPRSARWQEGRLTIRLRDVDQEARPEVESEPAFAPVDRRNLDRLPRLRPTGGEAAILDRFLQSQGIGAADPDHDLRGNVCGDRRPERVVHVGRFLVVFGAGYKDGSGFDFAQLPVSGAADVQGARLVDLTGDGNKELLLRMTQRDDRGSRTLWQLFRFDCQSIAPLFGIEMRKETQAGHLESEIEIGRARGGRAPEITVTAKPARGISPQTWHESPSTDAESILLPWGPVLARTYRWDGQRFASVRERENPRPYVARQPRQEQPRRERTQARQEPTQQRLSASQLLEAAKRERGISRRARPSFRREINVAGTPARELVAVFGNALVVVGPEFRGGQGYFYYAVPVANPDDLLDVQVADLTGDGRAEILLRARQTLGDIQRELLMVHRFVRDGSFPLALSVEVARHKESSSVTNDVRVQRGTLEIRPGRARGWNQSTWPWGADSGSGDVDPLLLPWRDRPVRYRFENGRLSRTR